LNLRANAAVNMLFQMKLTEYYYVLQNMLTPMKYNNSLAYEFFANKFSRYNRMELIISCVRSNAI